MVFRIYYREIENNIKKMLFSKCGQCSDTLKSKHYF